MKTVGPESGTFWVAVDHFFKSPVELIVLVVVFTDEFRGAHHLKFVDVCVEISLRVVEAAEAPTEHSS